MYHDSYVYDRSIAAPRAAGHMTSIARNQLSPAGTRLAGSDLAFSDGNSAAYSPAASRSALLDAIGSAPELTFVRPHGNVGDELIWHGTRELLSGHIYREVGIDDLCSARGELAVIGGGGAWSRRFNAYMPEVLAVAQRRFERVIVLPSTFEIAEDRVREALARTNAVVFARELISFEQIRGVCDARFAHDCAFFADLSSYSAAGSGELIAFRDDEERPDWIPVPEGNRDISAGAESLDQWLRTIERHRVVRTNRAHVMIAAGMMGKQVIYSPCSYFKIEALAATCPPGFDNVAAPEHEPLPASPAISTLRNRATGKTAGIDSSAWLNGATPRTTVAIITSEQTDAVAATIAAAAAAQSSATALIHDRNSSMGTRSRLAGISAAAERTDVVFADRDGGVVASAIAAIERCRSEFVLLLDGEMQLRQGAIDALVSALAGEPDALAATATLEHTGEIPSCGGSPMLAGDVLSIERTPAEFAGSVPETAVTTGWVPLLGTLFRCSAFERHALHAGLDAQCAEADWNLRATVDPGAMLLAVPEAVIEAAATPRWSPQANFSDRAIALRGLSRHAEFLQLTGCLLSPAVFELVPELAPLARDARENAARLLLAQLATRGVENTLIDWMTGDLAALWRAAAQPDPDVCDASLIERLEWLESRNGTLTAIENGGWWRLRERLMPLRRAARAVSRRNGDAA